VEGEESGENGMHPQTQLILAVDCIFNPALIPPLLITIDHYAHRFSSAALGLEGHGVHSATSSKTDPSFPPESSPPLSIFTDQTDTPDAPDPLKPSRLPRPLDDSNSSIRGPESDVPKPVNSNSNSIALVMMELRDEDVVREFLTQWTALPGWEIRRVIHENWPLDERFVTWVGFKNPTAQ
jgi:hypothetical protein